MKVLYLASNEKENSGKDLNKIEARMQKATKMLKF